MMFVFPVGAPGRASQTVGAAASEAGRERIKTAAGSTACTVYTRM